MRIVPARGLDGCAFGGPGVDLVGADASDALAAARPLVEWLVAREPGIRVRSLSLDVARARVLVTYEPVNPVAALARDDGRVRPHVLRVDPPLSSELVDGAAPLLVRLGTAARERLARRAAR